jgi:hypothetical protein
MAYPSTSPYYFTNLSPDKYLEVMVNRAIPFNPNDQYWEITTTYNLRPDLLAFDLYEDSRLWWVFAQRNPNKIRDPLNDFVTGVSIYLPSLDVLKASLGV